MATMLLMRIFAEEIFRAMTLAAPSHIVADISREAVQRVLPEMRTGLQCR
jgi:hypothetical protein